MPRCWRVVLLTLGVTFCLIPVLGLVRLTQQLFVPPPIRLTRLNEVSRIVPLTFPKDAVLMDGTSWAITVNGYLGARIRMPRGEMRRFLAQPPFGGQVSSTDRDLLDSYVVDPRALSRLRRESGWHPETAHHFLSASGSFPTGSFNHLSALIDLDDPTTALLYLYYQE